MYLSGSKWNLRKSRRRRSHPGRILALVVLIGVGLYLQFAVVPNVPPLLIPTPTPTRSPASFLLEAESLFASGKLAQAEESYRQAIAVDPDEAAYYIALARVQVFAGRPQDAVTTAQDAVLIDPNSALAHAVLAWAYDFTGDLIRARQEIDTALALDPSQALIHAYHAEILADSDLYDEAGAAARRALELDPQLLEAHRAMGYVLERVARYSDAVTYYQTAIALNPNLPLLHISLGNMYRAQGEIELAVDSYTNAIALAPTDPTPLTLLAQTYAGIGEYGKASQWAAEAVRLNPSDPFLHGNLGRMLYHNFQYEEAVPELALAVRGGQTDDGTTVEGLPLDPGQPRVVEFYYTYGLALARTGDCEQAIPLFETLIRGVPDDATAQTNAVQGLVLCGVIEPTPTPRPTASPTR